MLWPSADTWWSRDSPIRLLPFHFLDLFKPAHVALASVEARTQKRTDELRGKFRAHHLGAEAEHVHVVVLDALVGRVGVVADGCADPSDLARRHGGADPRAAHEHCPLGVAARSEEHTSELQSHVN